MPGRKGAAAKPSVCSSPAVYGKKGQAWVRSPRVMFRVMSSRLVYLDLHHVARVEVFQGVGHVAGAFDQLAAHADDAVATFMPALVGPEPLVTLCTYTPKALLTPYCMAVCASREMERP